MLGGWSYALFDYFVKGFTNDIDSANTRKMISYIGPMSYAQYYTDLPYLIISATNDEFFMPDDDRFYWDYMGH